jgi:hypothetical protein
MSDKPETIVIGKQELDPAEQESYLNKISQARGKVSALKGSTPLGHVPKLTNTPILSKEPRASSPITDEGGVQPRPPGSPIIRPETQKELEKFAQAQQKQVDKAEVELKKEVEESKEEISDLFDSFNNRNEVDRLIDNKKRRKEIESRLTPMKLEDLILRDEVSQEVQILPGKFWVVFRSITPQESLFVKQRMSEEKVTSDQYMLEKYSLSQITCALVSINGVVLPTHLDDNGMPKEELFVKKFKMLQKKPSPLLHDIGTNYYWFEVRVRQLLNPGDLKNG